MITVRVDRNLINTFYNGAPIKNDLFLAASVLKWAMILHRIELYGKVVNGSGACGLCRRGDGCEDCCINGSKLSNGKGMCSQIGHFPYMSAQLSLCKSFVNEILDTLTCAGRAKHGKAWGDNAALWAKSNARKDCVTVDNNLDLFIPSMVEQCGDYIIVEDQDFNSVIQLHITEELKIRDHMAALKMSMSYITATKLTTGNLAAACVTALNRRGGRVNILSNNQSMRTGACAIHTIRITINNSRTDALVSIYDEPILIHRMPLSAIARATNTEELMGLLTYL